MCQLHLGKPLDFLSASSEKLPELLNFCWPLQDLEEKPICTKILKKNLLTLQALQAQVCRKTFAKVGFLNKRLCLAAALGVTKFTTVVSLHLVSICCAA